MFVGRSDLANFVEVRYFIGIHHPYYTHNSTGKSVSIFYTADAFVVLFCLKTMVCVVGGNLIANSLFTVADYSHLSFTTLSLSQSFQGLSYVVFDALGSSNRVGYDNFVINETVPVPEPSTLLVLGLGLAGIGFAKKKKSHKSN